MSADNSASASEQQLSSRFVPCSSMKRRRISSTEPNPPPAIGKLTDDLLVEILIRLPNPRSASRCKAVCKGWRCLISDPIGFNRRFVSHHRSRNQQPPLLLPSDDPQSIITSFLPPVMDPFDRDLFTVLDSYKDLLLCGFEGVSPATSLELERSYLVCNPFTKQWVALPLAPELPMGNSRLSTKLVCEPRISHNLDLGDDHQVFVHYEEYRFRVVRLYDYGRSTKGDLFCSDSREWTKGVLVLDGPNYIQPGTKSVVSCNGELFRFYALKNQGPGAKLCIAAFNPFRPDIPPTAIGFPLSIVREGRWNIAVSQGALHVIVLKQNLEPDGSSTSFASVWRLEDYRTSWRKLCVGSMKGSRLHQLRCIRPKLHPGMPEVVFFASSDLQISPFGSTCPSPFEDKVKTGEVVSCNLKAGGELELFADLINFRQNWNLFQVEFSCWPTSIPKYEELRVAYDGSYSYWVQSNDELRQRLPSR